MVELDYWAGNLEKLSFALIVVSAFGGVGNVPCWNVAVGVLGLHAVYSASGRINLMSAAVTFLTFIVDITWLGVHGDDYRKAKKEFAFGLAMLCIAFILKLPIFLCHWKLKDQWGTSHDSGAVDSAAAYSDSSYQAPNYQQGGDVADDPYGTGV